MAVNVPRMTNIEAAAWTALVTLAERLPNALDAQLMRDAGLINFEYGILAVLNAADGRCLRSGDLASAVGSPAPRLSKAIRRLEGRGLVERVAGGSGDGRAVNVRLTRDGRRAWLRATPPHIEFARGTLLSGLSDMQLTALSDLLVPILDRLQSDAVDGD